LIITLTRFSKFIIKNTIWIDFTSQSLQWNVLTMLVTVTLISWMALILATLLAAMTPIIPFINLCWDIAETLLSFIAVSVWWYTYFVVLVNLFFASIAWYITFYTSIYLVSLFWRLQ
jgi:hypothetical protein